MAERLPRLLTSANHCSANVLLMRAMHVDVTSKEALATPQNSFAANTIATFVELRRTHQSISNAWNNRLQLNCASTPHRDSDSIFGQQFVGFFFLICLYVCMLFALLFLCIFSCLFVHLTYLLICVYVLMCLFGYLFA
jgi:hypothetical protein